MPLSEFTSESYFKTATLVRDWQDYHFCGRMFHPLLLASNCFLFASVKTGISIQLVAIANLNVTPATLLDLIELHQMRLDFLFVLADS